MVSHHNALQLKRRNRSLNIWVSKASIRDTGVVPDLHETLSTITSLHIHDS